MRGKKPLTFTLLISFFMLFAQSQFTFGKSDSGTIWIENKTKATMTIHLERGVSYSYPIEPLEGVEIPPMMATRLENFLPKGRIHVVAVAKKAPGKRYRDGYGNVHEEYYSTREIFWVSGEATKVHKWILTPELFGAIDLEDKSETSVSDEKKIIDLAGTWISKKGKYKIKQKGNEITWFGSGYYNDKYWEHNGRAVILPGNKLEGSFTDTKKSSWPGNSMKISGTILEDGNTLSWPMLNPFEREWKKQ
jgi:hypothetical protein